MHGWVKTFLNISGGQIPDLRHLPFPPTGLQKTGNGLLIEPVPDDLCGNSGNDGIRRHILRYDRPRPDHRAIANGNAIHDHRIHPHPHVVPDRHGESLLKNNLFFRSYADFAIDRKTGFMNHGISGKGIQRMASGANMHIETDGTESADPAALIPHMSSLVNKRTEPDLHAPFPQFPGVRGGRIMLPPENQFFPAVKWKKQVGNPFQQRFVHPSVLIQSVLFFNNIACRTQIANGAC